MFIYVIYNITPVYLIMRSLHGNVGPKYRNVFIFLTCNNIHFDRNVHVCTVHH